MYRRLTPQEEARQAELLKQQQERMEAFQRNQAQLEADRQARQAKQQEQQAFLEKVQATRAAYAHGNLQVDVKDIPTLATVYTEKTAQVKAAAMQARKEHRDASKDVTNVPSWLVSKLPPGDPLRKQAGLMTINPEDYQ